MDITVYNTSFQAIAVVDAYSSLIWNDRFNEAGDFELVTRAAASYVDTLAAGNLLSIQQSEHWMIIESNEIKTDSELGDSLVVKGRSLESILERRIVWEQMNLSGNFQTSIQGVLNANLISPSDANRQMANVIFSSSVDSVITALTISGQYHGENLLLVITDQCKTKGIGFKMVPNSSNQIVFSLYAGYDRSYAQAVNPYVVFSKVNENLLSSDHKVDTAPLRTVALVFGEGQGTARLTTTVNSPYGSPTGFERREVSVDGSSISRTTTGGTMAQADYLIALAQFGLETLMDMLPVGTFDGEADTRIVYVYGRDFFMGDIVQIMDEFGHGSRLRVEEFLLSDDQNGLVTHPKFAWVS